MEMVSFGYCPKLNPVKWKSFGYTYLDFYSEIQPSISEAAVWLSVE